MTDNCWAFIVDPESQAALEPGTDGAILVQGEWFPVRVASMDDDSEGATFTVSFDRETP